MQKKIYKAEWKSRCLGKLLLIPQKAKHRYHMIPGVFPRDLKIHVHTKTFLCENAYSRYYS